MASSPQRLLDSIGSQQAAQLVTGADRPARYVSAFALVARAPSGGSATSPLAGPVPYRYDATKSMSQRRTIDRIVDTIQRAAAEEYAQLFAEGAVLEHPLAPEPLRGRAIIREGEQALFDAFSDIEIEVRSTTCEQERIVVEVVLRAINTGSLDLGGGEPIPATGRRIEVAAVWIFEFDSAGLIRAERDYFDTSAMLAQLGLDQ